MGAVTSCKSDVPGDVSVRSLKRRQRIQNTIRRRKRPSKMFLKPIKVANLNSYSQTYNENDTQSNKCITDNVTKSNHTSDDCVSVSDGPYNAYETRENSISNSQNRESVTSVIPFSSVDESITRLTLVTPSYNCPRSPNGLTPLTPLSPLSPLTPMSDNGNNIINNDIITTTDNKFDHFKFSKETESGSQTSETPETPEPSPYAPCVLDKEISCETMNSRISYAKDDLDLNSSIECKYIESEYLLQMDILAKSQELSQLSTLNRSCDVIETTPMLQTN